MSLGSLRADALACHAAALAAVAPERLVGASLVRTADGLALTDAAHGRPLARHAGPVLLVGGGKAALGMARAAVAVLADRCAGGIIVVPRGAGGACPGGVVVAEGAHPVPDEAGAEATRLLIAAVEASAADTLVVVVLSGGASALLVAPADGVTLADKRVLTAALVGAGADIATLNCIRKHVSRVKGGGLLRAAAGAAGVWTLALSDVVGDDPATIASGPTVADPTTFADAAAGVAASLPSGAVPAGITRRLALGGAGTVPETVKPRDPLLAHAHTVVVGSNRDAVHAAAAAAAARGYDVETLAQPLAGAAASAAALVVARLGTRPRDRRVAVIAGGETTVRAVPGGVGGRSQHLALAAAVALAGVPAVVLAAGTDGVDGPSGAAGACVDGGTVARARAAGHDPARALVATDSTTVLCATGDVLVGGPTGTNVADLVVALRDAC